MPEPAPVSSSEVRKLYLDRLSKAEATSETLNRKNILVGNLRLATVALGVVSLWLILGSIHATGWLFLIPVALFVGITILHNRVIEDRDTAKRSVQFYQKGLLRLEDRWQGAGASGIRYSDPQHPYAIDLDLFGTGSLFELLCAARTPFGEDCLADWLKTPASPAEIRARQEAVRELQSRLELREALFVLGSDLPSENKTKPLSDWIAAPPAPTPPIVRWIGIALSIRLRRMSCILGRCAQSGSDLCSALSLSALSGGAISKNRRNFRNRWKTRQKP